MGYSSYDQYNNRDNYGAGQRLDLDRQRADEMRREQERRWEEQKERERLHRAEMEKRQQRCVTCGGSKGRFINELSRESNVVGSKWDPCPTCRGTGLGR